MYAFRVERTFHMAVSCPDRASANFQGGDAHHLCPIHFFWPLIRERARSGTKLFPSYYDAKVNNTLKAIIAKLEAPRALRYSSHGFRRGAANELKTRGSQWSVVAALGEWRSLCFTGYVDLTPELDRDMDKRLIETEDIDSDFNDEVGHWVRVPFCSASDLGCWGPAALG